jgi:hypothetical protein
MKPPPTKRCPGCGGVMTRGPGVITELVVDAYGKITRAARPATFYACATCEHCEE